MELRIWSVELESMTEAIDWAVQKNREYDVVGVELQWVEDEEDGWVQAQVTALVEA